MRFEPGWMPGTRPAPPRPAPPCPAPCPAPALLAWCGLPQDGGPLLDLHQAAAGLADRVTAVAAGQQDQDWEAGAVAGLLGEELARAHDTLAGLTKERDQLARETQVRAPIININ